jgi:hypothetical protein
MGNEPMNASNTNATQKGKINEQHQNVGKSVVQKAPTTLSTIH